MSLSLQPMTASRFLPFSILAEDFPVKLCAFNELTRDLRKAGIAIKHLVLVDNKIFIELDSVDLFLRRFGHELRGMRYTPDGKFTRNAVKVRAVDVVWYSLAKEQDQ